MPHALLCGKFLLNAPFCFMWGVSLTHPVLFPVGSFSYTLDAVLCGEFLLHASCCSMWGVYLTCPMLFYLGRFLLHAPCCFMWGASLTLPCCFMWGVSLTRPCCFMWGVSLTRLVLFYVGSFSYTPLALLCAEFLLHALCYFFSGGPVCRYPIRRVERSLCRLCRERRNKLNTYNDKQVHLWTCRTAGRSLWLEGREA